MGKQYRIGCLHPNISDEISGSYCITVKKSIDVLRDVFAKYRNIRMLWNEESVVKKIFYLLQVLH